MLIKNTILLFFVITLLGCTEKFEELETTDNLLADETIVLFEITDVIFIPRSAFVSDVVINFNSNYNELSSALKGKINQIAVYKNGSFQFTIDDPSANSFTDENEMRNVTHCYQFAYSRVGIASSGQGRETSRLSEEVCFNVE